MKIRMAMIGGGEGSFIGPVHRMAATLDGHIELVSGAFSSNSELSKTSGAKIGIAPERVYSDWQSLIKTEALLPSESRPHFISIVTPNHLHFGPIIESLNAGFHVLCDKPLCLSINEAKEIENTVKKKNLFFCITYNYTGYPLVKKARELVADGYIGEVRKVAVEYFQGWLSTKLEETGHKQAQWRADPEKAGNSGCMADIGTHAFNLLEYITGDRVEKIFASLNRIVENRVLDDDGTLILSMEGGATGSLLASQVALGEENMLKIRIYGSKGSLEWEQMKPNSMTIRYIDKPYEVYRTATGFPQSGDIAAKHSRLPAGHPEGFIEAFANLYRNFALGIEAKEKSLASKPEFDYPGIEDGVRGMIFLDAVIKSSNEERWIKI